MAIKNQSSTKAIRPKFATMLANYKGGGTGVKDVVESVFDPAVDKKAIAFIESRGNNTCALRISDALNRSGWVLPEKWGKSGDLSWQSSITKQYYVLGSTSVADLLELSWGYNPPSDRRFDTAKFSAPDGWDPIPYGLISAFAGKHGVIFFKFHRVSGYEGKVASGHITLWDGTKSVYDTGNCIYGPFSNEAAKKAGLNRWVSEIWFFELP